MVGTSKVKCKMNEEKYVTIFNEDTNDSGFILLSKTLMKELKEKGWKPGDTLNIKIDETTHALLIENVTKGFREGRCGTKISHFYRYGMKGEEH